MTDPQSTEARHSEAIVRDVWLHALEVKSVGADDNFFEIGGNSLLAAEVVSEIGKRTGHRPPIRTLYMNPTIRQLAAALAIVTPSTHDGAT